MTLFEFVEVKSVDETTQNNKPFHFFSTKFSQEKKETKQIVIGQQEADPTMLCSTHSSLPAQNHHI